MTEIWEATAITQSPCVEPEIPAVEIERPTVRDVLHRAADLLEEFGWCQGRAGSKADGAMCAGGAVIEAVADFRNGPNFWTTWSRFCEKYRGTSWNDAPGRTKEEVVTALREAAERAH
jgi:hypothetical protein